MQLSSADSEGAALRPRFPNRQGRSSQDLVEIGGVDDHGGTCRSRAEVDRLSAGPCVDRKVSCYSYRREEVKIS